MKIKAKLNDLKINFDSPNELDCYSQDCDGKKNNTEDIYKLKG